MSYLEPWIFWKDMKLWRLRPDSSCLWKVNVSLKNLQVLLKAFNFLNSFTTHTDNSQIKLIDSSSSRNKLYSAFPVDSMLSSLVHISDRHLRSLLRIYKFYWLNKYFHKILYHQTTINPHQKIKELRIKTR